MLSLLLSLLLVFSGSEAQWGLFNQGGGGQQGGGMLGGLLGGLGGGQNGGGFLGFGGGQNQGGGMLGGLLGGGQRPPPGGGAMGDLPNGGGVVGSIIQGITGNEALTHDIMGTVNAIASIPMNLVASLVKADVVEDMRMLQGKAAPPPGEWDKKARKFCRRFPNHPNCRGGMLPQYNQLGGLLQSISGSVTQFLPGVPRVPIRDPLAGVDQGMRGALQGMPTAPGNINAGRSFVQSVCSRRNCKRQEEKHQKTKKIMTSKLFDFEQRHIGEDAASHGIQLRFDRTQQIKEALINRANLQDVVAPADNGIYDMDTLLTEQQANFLLNELGQAGNRRAKRASIFFEENPTKQWPSTGPIIFVFDESISEMERNDVRAAIMELQRNTCIRFKEASTAPAGNHIMYYKVDSPTFCGLSYVGRVDPANPIYLSFQCQNNMGVALHETMHALGVAHQHLRMDRDQYITVDWNNVNPQQYDAFVIVDSKMYSSYGVKYDYGSVMHYVGTTAAIDPNKPTMIAKFDAARNQPLMGQRRGMSATDIEIVTKMYCQPACKDKNVYCGAWALRSLCNSAQHRIYMSQNCQKSCNYCQRG